MRPEQLKRVRDLFDELADLPDAARRARLDEIAQSEPKIGAALRRLLVQDEGYGPATYIDDDGWEGRLQHAVAEAAEAAFRDRAPIREGDRLGRYIAVRRMGSGGMAEVWAVRHANLGTLHALKVLHSIDSEQTARLLAEGAAQARMHHHNLVPVREVLELDGVPGLLMPLVDGPSLGQLLRDGPVRRPVALALFGDVVNGMAHVHDAGLVHRDLKPDNVLLDTSGARVVARVTDFGLVKNVAVAGPTRTGVIMGTPAYAAPEQLTDASSADARCDVFSLGVLLFELCTGRRPFTGQTVEELRAAHHRPVPLDALPEDVAPLVGRMLSHDSAERPSSARALREAMGPLAQSGALRAPDLLARVRGLATTVEAPATRDSVIPGPRDPFVGRSGERGQLRERMLAGARLITVAGPGGIGKTRLVQEVVRANADEMPHYWWVDLTEARDRDGVEARVAHALGLGARAAPGSRIAAAMRAHGRCVLLLDNVEQVVSHAAATVGEWLDQTTQATVVLTSRMPTRLRGEEVVVLAPLDRTSSRRLFQDRSRAAGSSGPDPAGPHLDRLLDLLDDLPLAIELAAARTRLYDVSTLVAKLSHRFRVLAGGGDDRPERQRTLRATLDWSWELLTPAEQSVLAMCCVFEGSFTLEAAQVVLENVDPDLYVDDVLDSLVDHSWLRVARRRNTRRLSMLMSVQAYAQEKLEHSAIDREALQRGHAHYFGRYHSVVLDGVVDPHDASDLENLAAAVEHVEAHGDAEAAARAALSAGRLLRSVGPCHRWLTLLDTALAAGPPPPWPAALHASRGDALTWLERNEEALAATREALSLATADTPIEIRADGLLTHGVILATRLFRVDEGKQAIQASHALRPSSRSLSWLGQLAYVGGDRTASRDLYQRSLQLARAEGDAELQATILFYLGFQTRTAGDPRGALVQLAEAREVAEPIELLNLLGQIKTQEAHCHRELGELDAGNEKASEAVTIHERGGNELLADQARAVRAHMILLDGDLQRAGDLFAQLVDRSRARSRHIETMREACNLAGIRIDQQRWSEAEALLEEVRTLNDARPVSMISFCLPLMEAWLALGRGQVDSAKEHLAASRALEMDVAAELHIMADLMALRALALAGATEAGLADVHALVKGARSAGGVAAAQALLELGRVHLARDEPDLARTAFRQSAESGKSVGARMDHAAALLEWARLAPSQTHRLRAEARELVGDRPARPDVSALLVLAQRMEQE